MATAAQHRHDEATPGQQSRIGIATLRFQNRKYQFPSIIVRNNGKQQCIMLDVCLLCPFCTGDINAQIIPLESRVLLAQGQNRHSYPPAGPDVVMQCEDLATSFARQFPHLLSPRSRHHLMHCNVADRLSQSAEESMMKSQPLQSADNQTNASTRLKAVPSDRTAQKTEIRHTEVPEHISDALYSMDSYTEGDSTQTSDTDSVDSVRYMGEQCSTIRRAFPHDVIRGVINESAKPATDDKQQETIKRNPKPPISPRSSPKQKKRSPKAPFSEASKEADDLSGLQKTGERTTAVVVKSTIHQTVAELLDLPLESDGEENDKPEKGRKEQSLDNIRSVSQLSDYGSMESMSNSHERLRRSRSEGMGSMDSSLHSTRKLTPKSEIKASISNMKELPESVTKDFVKLRSKVKKTNPDSAWSFDDLRELYKSASSGPPFRHSQGDRIATVYPVFDFRREASPRGRQDRSERPQSSPNASQINVASQSGLTSTNVILANQPQQLDVNANINSTANINNPNSPEAAVNSPDDRDPDERGIEDAEKEMERVVGEMTSLEAELEQMYRMTAKSRQQRPMRDGGAANLGDSSTTLTSLQERQRIEQEEIERMQELEEERRYPFVAEPRSDKKPTPKKDKQAKPMAREEAQFEEEERRVQLWLREQQKRQKILQKQNLTQQDRRRLQILNEQRRQQFLQERLRVQLEGRNQVPAMEQNAPSAMSQEDVKRRQKIKEKLQRQAEQLHQLQVQAFYQQRPANERQAEMQWQAIQEHHHRALQEQAEIANQNVDSTPPQKKERPPVPPKPTFGVPRVRNLARSDETPPEIRRMRNVMSFLEGSSQEALQGNKSTQGGKIQSQTQESSTSSSAAESYIYQHLYEDEAMASLENEDLNFYDEENDLVIDKTGESNKQDEADCLIQDPDDVYAQHIQAKDISQMLDILERVTDVSKKKNRDALSDSGSSDEDEEEAEVTDRDPEEVVDEILENIDTDSYSPNATLSRVFTTPRRKRARMNVKEPGGSIAEAEDQISEMADEVLERIRDMTEGCDSQHLPKQKKQDQEVKIAEVISEVVEESILPDAAQFTADDLVLPSLDEKQSSSTECIPDDNTSLEMERSICYSENTSETTSYDEDSLDLQVVEAKLSKESSAEIKQMIVKTKAMTHEIKQDQQILLDNDEVRLRMLSPIVEERSNRSSAVSTQSSDVLSPRSSYNRSSNSTDIEISHSGAALSNVSSPASSNRSSQAVIPTASTSKWVQESFESQVPIQDTFGAMEHIIRTSEDSVDNVVDESMLIEQVSRSASASPGDLLLTSSESESGASLQRRILSRNQHQLSPYAYEYGEAVGHEMSEPVHIRLYPSAEDIVLHNLPPEQANMQLTVMTDFLPLDNVFQEGKPALSPRSPQLFSPTLTDDTSITEAAVQQEMHKTAVPQEVPKSEVQQEVKFAELEDQPLNIDQIDILVGTEERPDHMAVTIAPPLQPQLPADVGSSKISEQLTTYTGQQQNLDIIEITTEVKRRKITKETTGYEEEADIKPSHVSSKETNESSQPAGIPDVLQMVTKRMPNEMSANEIVSNKSDVNETAETLSSEIIGASQTFTIRRLSSSSESLDVSSEEDEITNVIELLHKVKREYEPEIPKFESQLPNSEGTQPEPEIQEEKQANESDSGSEVVIDESGSGEVFKIKLDRQSSLRFQRLSRENSLRDDNDDISEEYAFNRHVRSLEKLASLSREAINVSSENLQQELSYQKPETVEPVEVVEKEKEAIHRLESLITVDSEPSTPENVRYTPGLIDPLLEDDFGIPLEMTCSMESIEEVDEQIEETEEDEAIGTMEIERSISETSQLDIIIEEEDRASFDSKTSSPSKKSVINVSEGDLVDVGEVDEVEVSEDDVVEDSDDDVFDVIKSDVGAVDEVDVSEDVMVDVAEDDVVEVSEDVMVLNTEVNEVDVSEDDVADNSEDDVADNSDGAINDDNVSAETSSSFAMSEGSTNSGQPDLLHNVIVCAGARIKRGSDADSIVMDSDSSSDGFGSMKASTLKIRMTDKKPPIHPTSEIKLMSSNYTEYGDFILGHDDREDTPEAEMAIFNFKQALAMFEGITQRQAREETDKQPQDEEPKRKINSYVSAAVRSHEQFAEEATFGNRIVHQNVQDNELSQTETTQSTIIQKPEELNKESVGNMDVPTQSPVGEFETEVNTTWQETIGQENATETESSHLEVDISEKHVLKESNIKSIDAGAISQENNEVTRSANSTTPDILTAEVHNPEVISEGIHKKESSPTVVEVHVHAKLTTDQMMNKALEEKAGDVKDGESERNELCSTQEINIFETNPEIIDSSTHERLLADIEDVREISPVTLAACDGEEVLISLDTVNQKDVTPSHAGQLESPPEEEIVETIQASSPAQPELLLHVGDLSTIQDISQEESLVFESELVNADSCAELSSRDSEASDVTVISSSVILDSKDDLTQEPTRVEEIGSPSPDSVSLLSSSEDLVAERLSTPLLENALDTSLSSQETSFVLERQESLSDNEVRNLTPTSLESSEEALIQFHAPKKDLIDFERSLSSQEASFVLERNDSASEDNDFRDMTPVPDDNIDDVTEVTPKVSRKVSQSSAPDILIADYDDLPSVSDENLDKRSTIDSQKSAISLIQAVSKTSDTEEVITVSPDVTQISLLEQQAEYQRYRDDLSPGKSEQSSSSARSSMTSTQEKFDSYMDVTQEEVQLEVPRSTMNQQSGILLMQPGVNTNQEHLGDSFDELHRSPSFPRNRPRRSPSTSSSEKASMTYSQERAFETSFDNGQPITEWHATRTATFEAQGNVLYHEESQISSDTEGSLRRKRKVLIKRPSADSNDYETQTFEKEDISPSPILKRDGNIVAIRTDSVSEGEEGDDEKEMSVTSSSSASREGSYVRYSSAEDVNDILEKVRAVVFEANKYQQQNPSQAETKEQSNGDIPDGSMSESGVGATAQDIKDYFINREDEDLKKKQMETEEFLRNILHQHHHEHVSRESSQKINDVTDISACLEEVCRALSESDSDEIVIDEDLETQEVTLIFAWPKSLKPAFQYPDRPYREICMRRITKIRDFDIDVVEGPEIESNSASGLQSDSNHTTAVESSAEQQAPTSQDNNEPAPSADIQHCQTED